MVFTPYLFRFAYMHIPDGMLSLSVSIICWLITASLLIVAIRRTQYELGERQVPLMGIMAAFIFAAQMINFPVLGGTSGHLLGGALAAIALGPWAGMLVMAAVIIVQGLLFQDGGILVMGANILNMGILPAIIGYGFYRSVSRRSIRIRLGAAGFAAWLSVIAAALFTSLQLWLSQTAQLNVVVPAMLSIHVLIGIGEALITVAALSLIFRTRPELVTNEAGEERGSRGWIVAGALISLAVIFISPLASADPDGLERVAINLGFIHTAQSAPYHLLPNYTLPFLGQTPLSTILAGGVGALLVAGLTFLVVRLIRKPPQPVK